MTSLIARPPLQVLSMSSVQSGSRRQSARLQQKDDHPTTADGATTNGHHGLSTSTTTTKVQTSASNPKKRKKKYDEEDDGFVFSRVKTKRPRQSTSGPADAPVQAVPPAPAPALAKVSTFKEPLTASPKSKKHTKSAVTQSSEPQDEAAEVAPKKRQKRRMSFSTPAPKKDSQPVRRSKRLSAGSQQDQNSPTVKPPPELKPPKIRRDKVEKQKVPVQKQDGFEIRDTQQMPPPSHLRSEDESHSATKIALPFADTPVISRNKAMREGKSGKSERRSSMGLRGRRASSLIDSGTSNGKYWLLVHGSAGDN